ncbi:MAG: RNA pseudouridine synthase [Treponema sp.]|jgi:23S rRNA pseudouridine1911/1915/1917 synthase|nr:RNA pseudouridine synthase [Treponema sp.]
MNRLPVIHHETEDFAVVFKPPRMHCAPLRRDGAPLGRVGKENETLLDWYSNIFPPVMELSGRKEGEGGLLHRLDFETQGLVLFAKNRQALENLLIQQKQGSLIKEYGAVCQKHEPQPGAVPFDAEPNAAPQIIESYFRPYGQGRKQVRPVTEEKLKGKEIAKDAGACYRTEITGIEKKQIDSREFYFFTVRLMRGFRHQIRCHLAWVGFPVLNDPLYGKGGDGFLALRATGLFFDDPKSGEPVRVCVEPLSILPPDADAF